MRSSPSHAQQSDISKLGRGVADQCTLDSSMVMVCTVCTAGIYAPQKSSTSVHAGSQGTFTGLWGYKSRLISRLRSSSVPLRLALCNKCTRVCTL
jgi:hypothetical protein